MWDSVLPSAITQYLPNTGYECVLQRCVECQADFMALKLWTPTGRESPDRLRASVMSPADIALGKSCLLANTRRATPLSSSSSSWNTTQFDFTERYCTTAQPIAQQQPNAFGECGCKEVDLLKVQSERQDGKKRGFKQRVLVVGVSVSQTVDLRGLWVTLGFTENGLMN